MIEVAGGKDRNRIGITATPSFLCQPPRRVRLYVDWMLQKARAFVPERQVATAPRIFSIRRLGRHPCLRKTAITQRRWPGERNGPRSRHAARPCCVRGDQAAVTPHMRRHALPFCPAGSAAQGYPRQQHTPRCTAHIRHQSWPRRSARPACA